jgi:two-component sensor histidine kinase
MLYGVSVSLAQPDIATFRKLEQQVKFSNPDSLHGWAMTLDSTKVDEATYYYWAKARAHYWNGLFPESYEYMEKAAEAAALVNSPTLLGEVRMDLSASLSIMEQTGRALEQLLEARDLLIKHGTPDQKVRVRIALGELYRKIAKFDDAFKALYLALPDAKNSERNLTMCYNRLAAVHTEAGSLDSSLYYSNLALKLATKLNDPNLMAISENEIGYIQRIRRQFEEALPHFIRADSLWQSVGMLRFAIHAMHHISVCYGSINRIDESLTITHKAYGLIRGKGWHHAEANLLEDLRNLSRQMNRPDSGDYYEMKRLEAVLMWKDQQYTMNSRMVEVLYTQRQNEELIARQQLELKNHLQLEKIIKTDRIYLMVIAAALLFLALALGYIAYLQKKKRKSSLKKQQQIEAQKVALELALVENQTLLQELHHRIKNNLQQISTLIDMQRRTVTDEGGKSALSDAQRRISAMGTVHEMLYSYQNLASIHVHDFLNALIVKIKELHGQKEISPIEISLKLDAITLKTSDAIPLGMIVSEAVSNSIKHRNPDMDTKVNITLQAVDNKLHLVIQDNNAGKTDVLAMKRGERLGIRLMEIFSQKLNGTLNFVQGENGLIVELTFPIS